VLRLLRETRATTKARTRKARIIEANTMSAIGEGAIENEATRAITIARATTTTTKTKQFLESRARCVDCTHVSF
jgi:hypothetical protein